MARRAQDVPGDGPAPADLDFWSFVALATRRLRAEHDVADPLATEVLLTLNRASEVVTYDLEATVHRPRGRSWAAYRLMFVLWLAGPMEPSVLARLAGTSRAAVSNLSKPLLAARLLTRTGAARDGRSVTLGLSAQGEAEMRSVFADQNRRESAWTSALSDDERRTLVTLLGKLIDHARPVDARNRH